MNAPENPDHPQDAGSTAAKKLHVDEDWKSQVEAEKHSAAADQHATAGGTKDAAAPQAAAPGAASPRKPEAVSRADQATRLPPADLSTLISMLAAQAMVTLGALPNPLTGQVAENLPEARHFIDLIEVVEQKTRGNATPQEAAMLDGLLHQLRLAFVEAETGPTAVKPVSPDRPG